MNWLDKLERKYGRYAIPNLMQYICITMVAIFAFDLLMPGVGLGYYASFIRGSILRGQIWRLVTFIFLPPASRILTMFIAIYFYYYIGRDLEYHWGSFKFNIYYFCGILGCIAAGFISGYGSNTYLNLSLFLAYAALFPDTEFLLFFVIPVKAKYLAYLDWAIFGINILFGSMSTRLAALFSLANFFLFFGPGMVRQYKNQAQYRQVRKNFRSQQRGPWNNNNPWG